MHFFQSILVLFLVSLSLFSCQKELPEIQDSVPSSPKLYFDQDTTPHQEHPFDCNVVCSDTTIIGLQNSQGLLSPLCGLLPCPGQNPYGEVQIWNTLAHMYFRLKLAPGYVTDEVRWYAGPESDFMLVAGVPVLANNASWFEVFPNPAIQVTQDFTDLATLGPCNALVAEITVYQFSFFGGINPNSEQTLHLYNPDWLNVLSDKASISNRIYPHCFTNCAAQP